MGAKRKRLRVVDIPAAPNYDSRDAFLVCEAPQCHNVVAHWAIPMGYSGPILCTPCSSSKESR